MGSRAAVDCRRIRRVVDDSEDSAAARPNDSRLRLLLEVAALRLELRMLLDVLDGVTAGELKRIGQRSLCVGEEPVVGSLELGEIRKLEGHRLRRPRGGFRLSERWPNAKSSSFLVSRRAIPKALPSCSFGMVPRRPYRRTALGRS